MSKMSIILSVTLIFTSFFPITILAQDKEQPKIYYDTDLGKYKSGREEDSYRSNQEILRQREKENTTLELEQEIKRTLEQEKEKACGKCEIISYTQFERNLGGGTTIDTGTYTGYNTGGFVSGHISGSSTKIGEKKETCVDIVIKNSDCKVRIIESRHITATTSKGNKLNPKGVYMRLDPGERYDGTICFGKYLSPIVKLELQ